MNIESDKPKTIFKYKTQDGKEFYSIGLSHKKQDGTYENGFMTCRFKKEVKLENKTKILIKGGWLDFSIKDKKTYPFLFINNFEIVEQQESIQEVHTKTEYDNDNTDIQLEDSDLPF